MGPLIHRFFSPISITLATSFEELTHWKRLWCWEGLGEGGEGDDRGWDGWMASLTRWMRVSVNSGSWWWTARPGMLRFMGSQRVGHNWAADLIWSEVLQYYTISGWLNPQCGMTVGQLWHLSSWGFWYWRPVLEPISHGYQKTVLISELIQTIQNNLPILRSLM